MATIEIEGASFASRDSLLAQAELAPGVHIFDVDPESLQRRLQTHPWVERAEVERALPGTVHIQITEHEPAGLVLDGQEYLLVDAQGGLVKPLTPSDPVDELLEALPLISGPGRQELEGRDGQARARVRQALEVASLWDEMGLAQRAPLSQLHADPVLGVSAVVGERGVEVRLGQGQWRKRLERFGTVWAELEGRGVDVEYVLVDQEVDEDEAIERVAVGPARAKDR